MGFSADVMRDKTDNALAIRGRENRTCIGQTFGQAIDPEPTVGIEHHLDDAGVFEEFGDVRPERRAQHAGTARDRFCLGSCNPHVAPGAASACRFGPDIGDE